jgi:hypothetical protein
MISLYIIINYLMSFFCLLLPKNDIKSLRLNILARKELLLFLCKLLLENDMRSVTFGSDARIVSCLKVSKLDSHIYCNTLNDLCLSAVSINIELKLLLIVGLNFSIALVVKIYLTLLGPQGYSQYIMLLLS